MTLVLDNTLYPAIRQILGCEPEELPNEALDAAGIVPFVNAYLYGVIPDASTLVYPNDVFAKAAGEKMAAALCLRIIQLKRSQEFRLGDMQIGNSRSVNWDKWREELLEEAKAALLHIASYAATLKRSPLMITTGPTSSGTYWPTNIYEWEARIRPRVDIWYNGYNWRIIK